MSEAGGHSTRPTPARPMRGRADAGESGAAAAALGARVLRLAEPWLPAVPGLDAAEREVAWGEVAKNVGLQLLSMPLYLQVPFRLALRGFETLSLLRFARPPQRVTAARRGRWLGHWSRLPLPPVRDWLRLVRSCVLFQWLDNPRIQARLEADAGAPRTAGADG